jgi:hypothetical protein
VNGERPAPTLASYRFTLLLDEKRQLNARIATLEKEFKEQSNSEMLMD